ncbi:MAG: hypothetical protein IJQ88_05545 [Clostridia bacterium]|nr:hypothetical protein [Clostridia bacterium]MBQ6721614.1 hypothetical protein [Clostridia bacterium]
MKQELTAGIVICLIGLSLLLIPAGKLWAITEKWKTREGGQPSKGYTIMMRILGAVFSVLGIILIVCGL